ncbi:MerR family transcriptional regulator [Kineosporia babensis]|uniref:MerR family transcriptional regulator n=1 Tax=Kineosporia babensis TaxID=499548 RepID=A0A9X1NIX1_9ACTN|nr:MerR family transcriptional regulator [Kineosporia babensis]MCD5314900.1 MerR family transcriptional regulator [Kineosporia babensis]
MRSAELARLTGVSVRALRHYHQLGVLAEPERSANGYREYTVRELVRVLRLKNLQAAGISLEAAAAMLDAAPGDRSQDELLDEVDQDLQNRIAELQAQRALIAQARAFGTAPDLPADLLHYAPLLVGASPLLARTSRDEVAYLAHVDRVTGSDLTRTLMEGFSELSVHQRLTELSERLVHLQEGDEEGVAALIDDLYAFSSSPEVLAFTAPMEGRIDDSWAALINVYYRDTMNPAQAAVIAGLEQRFSAAGGTQG